MKGEVRNHSVKTLERLIVMGILGFWLSPCWQWIPLHTKCNEVLFVGSAISRSIWAMQIPDKNTFHALQDTCCAA